jgi:hypothetical protein
MMQPSLLDELPAEHTPGEPTPMPTVTKVPGGVAWVARCRCGYQAQPMQGPSSAARRLRFEHPEAR